MAVDSEMGRQVSGGYDFCGYVPGEEYLSMTRRRPLWRRPAFFLAVGAVAVAYLVFAVYL